MGKFRRRAGRAASALLVLLAALALVLRPNDAIEYAKQGLTLCGGVIIPSLFPFFVLSSMVVELGLARYIGMIFERIMRPLFGVSGACATALALGFVGGYPTGARTAIMIYEKGLCTKEEAERMLAFCNNSGPAFILGVVGAGVFGSGMAGLLLYLAHALASIIVGIIFRVFSPKKAQTSPDGSARITAEANRLAPAFGASVSSALNATLGICAFVVFFTVVIKMLMQLGAIPFAAGLLSKLPFLDERSATQLLTGLIEISSGVWSLADAAGGLRQDLALAAFMLGWAGLSVHCQVLGFIGRSELSARPYILGKLLHGVVSAALVWCVAGLFRFDTPVSSILVTQVAGTAGLGFSSALMLSIIPAAMLVIAVLLASALSRRTHRRSRF